MNEKISFTQKMANSLESTIDDRKKAPLTNGLVRMLRGNKQEESITREKVKSTKELQFWYENSTNDSVDSNSVRFMINYDSVPVADRELAKDCVRYGLLQDSIEMWLKNRDLIGKVSILNFFKSVDTGDAQVIVKEPGLSKSPYYASIAIPVKAYRAEDSNDLIYDVDSTCEKIKELIAWWENKYSE